MKEAQKARTDILSSFTPVTLKYSHLKLDEDVRAALPYLKKAMDAMHEIFLRQQNEAIAPLIKEKQTLNDDLGEFYRRFQGPWYPVEEFASYDDEVADRDPRCSFYPQNLSKADFTQFLSGLPEEERELFEEPTTLIRVGEHDGHRDAGKAGGTGEAAGATQGAAAPSAAAGGAAADKAAAVSAPGGAPAAPGSAATQAPGTTPAPATAPSLKAVPYHQAYAAELAEVFDALTAAADMIQHEELSEFVRTRAETLVAGDYRDADAAWVRLKDTPLELVLGPYEVYADAFKGLKATYESMLMVVDREKCSQLTELEGNLEHLAKVFPVPEGSRPAVGGMAPMVVVHQIYASGEATQPIFAAAFNLPNDPWVRGNVGWKQVMLYNIMEQKFANCTRPIGEKVLSESSHIHFDSYFYFVLLHEVSHGLGPAYRSEGRKVEKSLGAYHTPLEEAKADSGGLYILMELGGQYGIPDFSVESVLESYVAGLFRSMRFGVKEAHGAANVIEHNWLMAKGVIKRGPAGYEIEPASAKAGVKSLLDAITEIQATGGEAEAEAFLNKWATPDEELYKTIASLSEIPVDIFIDYEL